MKVIDYQQMLDNTRHIINALEFDGMRSPGKVKFNVTTLNELYVLEKTLEEKVKPPKPQAKKQPVKEG